MTLAYEASEAKTSAIAMSSSAPATPATALVVVAYPHGRADRRVARVAREAGFTAGYTGVPVPVRAGDDPLILGRITPSHRSGRHLALQMVVVLLRRKGSAPRS